MPRVTVKNRQIWSDDQPVSMLGGEFHYWRLEPSAWKPVLLAARELGVDMITSYVQWHDHEYAPGRYDFVGATDPKRNLVAYLDLIKELEFDLAIRPGPYTFAEWQNYGIPDYVAMYHRLHPTFLDAASSYLHAVCDVIRPYLRTQGGPIVLCQADNMFDLGQGRYDAQLGLFGGAGPFQDYLQQKYGTVDGLNEAWRSSYTGFEQAYASTTLVARDPSSHTRYVDFVGFKHWYAAAAARWTLDQYRGNGIDVPLYSNATKDQNPAQMATILDILAFNHYPTHNYSLVTDEHAQLLNHVRLLAALSAVPYIAELESGIWHGYHYTKGQMDPGHYRLMMLTILAGGSTTWSWYMLHDRDNWYMSPFNNRGKKRVEVTSLFSQFLALAKQTQPHSWTQCTSTGVTYYPLHEQSTHSALEYNRTLEISKALYDAGLDFGFYNLLSPSTQPPLLFYDGFDWLEEQAQRHLVEYMEAGGHLVVFERFPRYDERLRPLNLLGIPEPDGTLSQGYMNTFYKDLQIHLGDVDAIVPTPAATLLYDQVPGEPIYASRVVPAGVLNDNVLEEYQYLVNLGGADKLLIGYQQARGKGSLIFLGVPASPDVVMKLHQYLGLTPAVYALHHQLQAVAFRAGNDHYLFALNNDTGACGDVFVLNPDEFPAQRYRVVDLLDNREESVAFAAGTSKQLPVYAEGKSGVFLKLTPQ